jgi:DNA sulfur modification protein DndD
VDAKALNSAYNNAVSMLEKKSREIKSLYEKQGALKREIENCNNVINELLKKDKSNLKLRGYITYTQKLFDWVNEAYTSKEVAIRSQLEMKVNSNFSRMYHGNRNILIDSKYRVKYMDITTEESDGLKAVKNFAFVSGLVELAKEALTGEDDLELGTQSFPMVMDAPFSNIDEIHIANICSILPDVAEQVIIAVMQKDWDQAADKLSSRIGKSYIIEKDIDSKGCEIETSTHFREV